MADPRLEKLAENLIQYSVSLKKSEKILIEGNGPQSEPLIKELMKAAYKIGAIPFYRWGNKRILRDFLMGATKEQIELQAKSEALIMNEMDAYIGFSALENFSELSDVPAEKNGLWMAHHFEPVHHAIRINKTKWAVLRYPTSSMAQASQMSSTGFEDFFYQVCNLDYKKMSLAMDPLVDLLRKTDGVHIKGPGTDLRFSIKDIGVVKCDGHRNIPDGEVYTAPVRDSVEGTLRYNTPSEYQGVSYDSIEFTFKKGKIVEAKANDSQAINRLLDSDEGARYIGEFAIGVNPYILHPMKETLFDEKIAGSFHFTPGNCYKEAPNGNHSSIHWDLVCIQREDYGGGEIYFDGKLIRKDGIFTLPELQGLNPENLK